MQVCRAIWAVCRSRQVVRNVLSNEAWNRFNRKSCRQRGRCYSTCPAGMKVTICGAAGCTGQPLALLLKQCPLLDEIALYDMCATCGYGMELSHVDTKCKVSSYSGRHMLCDALQDSKVVVIMARDRCDTFEHSSPVVTEIALQICNTCPTCFTIVATEPVESMVPLVSEIQRLRGVYNPRRLLGCVELNCVRANTVLADFLRAPPEAVRVPVVGGATPNTMVPVLSAAVHPCTMTQEQVECVTSCIMSGNEAVCAAKGCCTETACLAGAYAVARTTINVVKGLQGQKDVVQCAYVDSMGTCAPDCQFFASEEEVLKSSLFCCCLGATRLRIETTAFLCIDSLLLHVIVPCVPPTNWTCDCPDSYHDEYLASFDTCYTPPIVPCACKPPTNWTCNCPDSCRDEYLASICREMTCKCGSTELCWRPRPVDYDSARASNLTHQMPLKGSACHICQVPRSVAIEKEIRDRAKDPC
ncbi:malate dehydrogenase, mitochondrial-like [Ostrinia furnacalis]|uniref:malate dehydrogenase, mitochondrial-like n=1 Tax=Ostrinia furnacalis TaxID=93504 RepID=UPI00103DEF5E|nr:malate dehydrogenase, mitochondrial-like [Ostrinia furnacalis]